MLQRGRLVKLSVDGVAKQVWTTAPTLSAAMSDLGISTSDFTSVSRSKRLALTPTDIDVRTPKAVTLVHDGTTSEVTTTDATVGAVLATLSVSVHRFDRLSVPMTADVTDGMRIRLSRVTHKVLTRDETVPFERQRVQDPTVFIGDSKISTFGRDGVRQLRWAAVYVDGKLVGKTPMSPLLTTAAVTQVRSVGSKVSDPGSSQAIAQTMMAEQYGWGSDQFDCLVQMWNRESRWTVNAANPSGAYGIPQALPGSKMSSAGADWQTNPATQIKWGLGYIKDRYATPCGAWGFWQGHNFY